MFIVLALLCTTLSGCMVGPNFRSPASPNVKRLTETSLPAKTVTTKGIGSAGKAQYFVTGKNISAEWWRLFRSRDINALIDMGIANNPNLTAAYAALRLAQENFNVQMGNSMLPAFNGQLGGQRQLFPGASLNNVATPSSIFNLFNANVNVAYTLDIFGGARRQLEALAAQVDYQQFQLIAAYLTLTSNIVTTAVTIASLQAQIEATHSLIRAQEGQLTILRDQLRLGGVSAANVLTQQTLVAQTIATLPPLEKSLSINRHALAALIGTYPDRAMPSIRLSSLHLPEKIPVSFPSSIVRQRPDVRASEALLHVASAQIGVATANLFPQFTLSGAYGWQAGTPSTLFATTTNFWNIGTQIAQPIFHGGALFAQRRAAIASFDQAYAQYKQTVLQAFQNVADSLKAIEFDARTFKAQRAAELAAYDSLALTQQQYRLGGVSYLSLLTAQQQYQQTIIARIQAQAARYTDTAALFQALGGGWWNKTWCIKECLYEK